jgi:site-specific recombinase XerD
MIIMSELLYQYETTHRSTLRRIQKSELSAGNKSLIFKFREELFSRGLSTARVTKYMYKLLKLARWLKKDFADADLQDIKRVVTEIERSDYVPFTKKEHKMCLKKLFQWMKGMEEDSYPPEVKWIKLGSVKGHGRKLPEDMITQEELLRLINVAKTSRDRAFVSTLYESGCRIGELLLLKIGHVQFDSLGAQLRVNGKTGWRRIRIVSSVPYLTAWLNEHPLKNDHDAYLWVSKNNSLIRPNVARMLLARLKLRSGVKKKVNPHNFRHSRATYLANYLTEAQMNEYFGWAGGSDMAAVYVHLSGRDVDNAILKIHGIQTDEKSEEKQILEPKQCVRCNTSNPASNKFCSLCGLPLDQQVATGVIQESMKRKKADHLLDEMLKDPQFRRTFLSKAQQFVQP